MKDFAVTFLGRQKGAIGIFYKISDTVNMPKGSTKEEINLKLYDKYEHISQLKINN